MNGRAGERNVARRKEGRKEGEPEQGEKDEALYSHGAQKSWGRRHLTSTKMPI